jgi:hypothetical protein
VTYASAQIIEDGMTEPSKPDKPNPTKPPGPVLSPVSRLFLAIAGAMFGLLILKVFGIGTK